MATSGTAGDVRDSYGGATLRGTELCLRTDRSVSKGLKKKKKCTLGFPKRRPTERRLAPHHDKCHKQSALSYMEFMFKGLQRRHVMPHRSLAPRLHTTA